LGAECHIPNPEEIINPGRLALWFKNNNITITCLTPAMGQLLATKSSNEDTLLPDLRYAFFVGDVLTKKFVGHLNKIAVNCKIINMYGSTGTLYFNFKKLNVVLPIS
jgi:L-2-aminoadipate reductase